MENRLRLRTIIFTWAMVMSSAPWALDDLILESQTFSLENLDLDNENTSPLNSTGAAFPATAFSIEQNLNVNSHLDLLTQQPVPGQPSSNKTAKANGPKSIGIKARDAALVLPGNYFSSGFVITDIGEFALKGRGAWENLTIADLDIALDEGGNRYLPLIRLLERFEVRILGRGDRLFVQTEWGTEASLDLENRSLEINGGRQNINFISGVSDITGAREIYLSEEVIQEIFDISMEWDEMAYRYNARAEHSFSIWQREYDRFRGMTAKTVEPIGVPEAHGPVSPDKPLLSFVRTRANTNARYKDSKDTVVTTNLSQSIWGHALNGRYRLSFEQPNLSYSDRQGFFDQDRDYSVPTRFDWTRTYENHELSLGDTGFSLNDLAFPFVNISGVRANGSISTTSDGSGRSVNLSDRRGFVKTKSYTGTAETGSAVKLLVNNRTVEELVVQEDPRLPAGYGTYEFADILIPSGNLINIKVEITEPSGSQIILDKSTLRGDNLLPAGQLSFIGGMGTDRERIKWQGDGFMAGGRVLYGLSENLTLGATLAYQSGIHADNQFFSTTRSYADESTHLGAEISWLITPKVLFSADLAQSSGSGAEGDSADYTGSGLRLRANWYPTQDINVATQYFRYDDGFFNGVSSELHDREGYGATASWRGNRWLSLDATLGEVSDNVEGLREGTLSLAMQNITLTTDVLPYTATYIAANRYAPDDDKAITQMTLGANIDLPYASILLRQRGAQSGGLDFDYSQLINALDLPGNIELLGAESSQATITSIVGNAHRLSLDWSDYTSSERMSLRHEWRGTLFEKLPSLPFNLSEKQLSLNTMVGHDSLLDSYFIRNSFSFSLGEGFKDRVSFTSEYDQNLGLGFYLTVSMENLFSNPASSSTTGIALTRVSSQINPERGGVNGRVYVDQNANAKYDPGEPGLAGITIATEGGHGTYRSNEDGLFTISKRQNNEQMRLFVDTSSIPAHYKATHGLQSAFLETGAFTEVNFGMAPLVSIFGYLEGQSQEDLSKNEPMSSARVYLVDESGNTISESVTAGDGSFYLDSIPGSYTIKVDPQTIDHRYLLAEQARDIRISGTEEFQELEVKPLLAKLMSDSEMHRLGEKRNNDFDLNIPLLKEESRFDTSHRTHGLDLLVDSPNFDLKI